MATYSPVRQQFTITNAQGQTVPAAGYRLFTYQAGTSTKINTYTDFALLVPNTNPVVLDEDGCATIFLADGQFYKYVLAPPPEDVLHPDDPPSSNIWTQDNIPSTGLISIVVEKSLNYTILVQSDRNKFFSVDATAGNVTLSLPSAASAGNGFVFYAKLTVSGGNDLILDPAGADTIDGASSQTIDSEGVAQGYISDGVDQWLLFNRIFQGATPAPAEATYIVQTPNGTLNNEQALSALSTGFVQSTTTTGVVQTRVITGTANEITISNGDGASGNPTASLPSSLTFTGKTITGGTFSAPTLTNPITQVKDAEFTIVDDGDTSKAVKFQASGVTTATTRTKTFQDNSGTIYESGGTDVTVTDGGTGVSSSTAYGVVHAGTTDTGAFQNSGTPGSSGTIYRSQGAAALPAWSTATYPGTAGTSGTRLKSDGTNWINSTTTMPDSGTSGKVIIGDGTNYVESTPTFPNSSATALKVIRSDGTNWIASTATFSDTPSTAGKVLVSDGTNWITSTPTFPNSSATAGKFIRSDGTNWIASTPTLPTTGGSAGNFLRSDGTNWLNSTATIPDTYSQGDVIYASASNTLTALAKDTNATRFLSNTGSSNNPAWAQVPISDGVSGLGANVATFLATPSSSNLASALTGETGSGAVVFGTAPTIDDVSLGNTVAITDTITPTQLSADTDDWAPTGLSTASIIRASTDASRALNGLTGGSNGRIIILHNVGSNDLVLVANAGTSTAANRFALSSNLTLTADDSVMLVYDATSSRWRHADPAPGAGGGGGAPTNSQYVTLATDATLTNERVLTAGTGISVTDAGAGSTVTVAATTGRTGNDTDITDANGNELIDFTKVASAVNQIAITNAATGTNPILGSTGDDSNIGLDFQAKGTGLYRFLSTSSQSSEMRLYEDTDNGSNYVAIKPPASLAADYTITLPADDGTASQFLQTNGSGVTTWATVAQAFVQATGASTTAETTMSSAIPVDDSIPQSSEGTEILTCAITPTSSSNILTIKGSIQCVNTTSTSGATNAVLALFQDSTANALAAWNVGWQQFSTFSGTVGVTIPFTYRMTAGTTSSTTFKLRASAASGVLNRTSNNTNFGGACVTWMEITETTS